MTELICFGVRTMQRHQTSDRHYASLIFTSWKLIGLACLISIVPVFSSATWFIAGPILFISLVMGIIVLSRGGTVPGLIIVLISVVTAPICIAVAPLLSSHLGIDQMIASIPSPMTPKPEYAPQRQQQEQQQTQRVDKEAASINLDRAHVFFTNRLHAKALEEYQQAFRIHAFAPYQHIVQAMCAALCVGDFKAAEDIGQMFLPDLNWNDHYGRYVPMYTILSHLAQGKEREARDIAAKGVLHLKVGEWPYPIMLYLNDEISVQKLLEIAGNSTDKQTEALTFIGYKRSYSGETNRAVSALAWVVEKGRKDFFEYPVAKAEHERLTQRISEQISSSPPPQALPVAAEFDGRSKPPMRSVEPAAGRQVVMKPNGPRFGITARKCAEGIHIETVTAGQSATRCIDIFTGERLQMEPGDHILSVNGIEPATLEEFLKLVATSGQEMAFVIKDQRNGKMRKMKTTLAW